MNMTSEGLALIKAHEGFRGMAYRDPVGIWTIGYGHTSAAGEPMVRQGLTVSRAAADEILARDVTQFAKGVKDAVTRDISDQQFSALVSFAYNVGLGNFDKSSVLAAVNAGDFQRVPLRLNLWVKAGGRVLPGLVKRRAAEGAMFAGATPVVAQQNSTRVEPVQGKPAMKSRTIITAVMIIVFSLLQAASRGQWLDWSGAAIVAVGAIFIIRERVSKSRLEGM